jgi:hypothetical protein
MIKSLNSFTKCFLGVTTLLISQISFGNPNVNPSNFDIKLTLNPPPTIGKGYNSDRKDFAGYCVSSDAVVPTNPYGSLNLTLQTSQYDASSALGIQAGGRYRTGVTETSAAASFAKSTMNTGYTLNLVFTSDMAYSEGFSYDGNHPIKLNDNFKGPNGKPDPLTFYRSCGDEYVDSVTRSAKILAYFSISFVSEEERSHFAANFNFNSPVTNISAAIENAARNVSSKTTLVFNSLQLGGSPYFSGKSICPDLVNGKNSNNNCADAITTCSIGNFSECINVLKGIINYSASNFSDQLTSKTGDPQNYVVTNAHVQPYYMAGNQFPLPPVDTSLKEYDQELKALSEVFEKYFEKWVLASRLAIPNSTPRLSARQNEKMKLVENALHSIVQRITGDIEDCYQNGFGACRQHTSEIDTKINDTIKALSKVIGTEMPSADYEGMSILIHNLTAPETFAQYCDLADELNPDIKTTVQTLKSFAESKVLDSAAKQNLKKGDECQNYEVILKTVTDMDLMSSNNSDKWPIASLGPIVVLPSLEKLNLSGKNIQNISELNRLNNLVQLNLDSNYISNICDISNLSNLQSLTIRNQNQKLKSIDCLKNVKTLIYLDVRDNSSDLACPLSNESYCKIKDFSQSTVSIIRNNSCPVTIGTTAVSLNEKEILVSGGYTPIYGFGSTSQIYIADRDECRQNSAKLNVPRANHTMTLLQDGKILVAGGFTNTLELIEQVPSGINAKLLAARMDVSRSFHTSTLLPDGRVLIVGGYSGSIILSERVSHVNSTYQVFNPKTLSIEATGTLKEPRAEHTATLLNDGRVLILGGYSESQPFRTGEIIDPKTTTSQLFKNSMKIGRFGHTTQMLPDRRIIIAGGFNWTTKTDEHGQVNKIIEGLDSIEILDLSNSKITLINDKLSVGRGLMVSSVQSDGRVLFAGGSRTGQLFNHIIANTSTDAPDYYATIGAESVVEIFDPKTTGIYYAGHLTTNRSQMVSAPLDSNNLLILGGIGSENSLNSMELLIYSSVE